LSRFPQAKNRRSAFFAGKIVSKQKDEWRVE